MGVLGDVLLALAGVLAVAFAPLEGALVVLVAFWLLVPGLLSVPILPHIVLVNRLVLYALAMRMLLRGHQPGEARGSAFALTPAHGALGLLLAVWFFTGVGLTPAGESLNDNIHQWFLALDMAVLFVVVLAVARTLGTWKVVRAVAAVLTVSVAIAYYERITGHGWGSFFFSHLSARYQAPGAQPLQVRGGSHRATVNAQFALEYGWVLASLLPVLVVAAVRWSRSRLERASWLPRLAPLVPLAATVAVVFSGSRSAEVAGVAGLGVLVLLSGANRRLLAWAGLAALLGLAVLAVHPAFFTAAFTNGASDSVNIRLDRIPLLFSMVAGHPFTGQGFAFPPFGVDNGFVTVFITVGMLGLLAWIVLYVTAAHASLRGFRARRGSDDRLLAAACLVGVVELAVACATYDLVSTPESRWTLAVVLALSVATAERVTRPVRRRRAWAWRAVLPVAGIFAGSVAFVLAPVSASETLHYDTVVAWLNRTMDVPTSNFASQTLGRTGCDLMTAPETVVPGTEIDCLWSPAFYPLGDPTRLIVLVRGPTPASVAEEVTAAQVAIARGTYVRGGATGPITTGKPALAVTAPLIGGTAGLVLALIVPPWPWVTRTKRRRHDGEPTAVPARSGS